MSPFWIQLKSLKARATRDQMLDLLQMEFALPHDDQIVARMIFAQIIFAMEATSRTRL